jgi:predicted kinase
LILAPAPCHLWFGSGCGDCSRPGICVTSLNMRKWMRERLQRRKKKTAEPANQPAPPPLQPAYFDEDEASKGNAVDVEADASVAGRVEAEPQAEVEEQPETLEPLEAAEEPAAVAAVAAESPRGRSRRRRGGRGRGGRNREKAVAQTFAPAAGKGKASGRTAPGSDEAETPADEAEAATSGETANVSASVPAAPSRPPKGLVVLAIGLPGSGKSSWFKRHNIVPLSSDMLRSVLFDDVREQRFQDLVFSNLRSMLKARLIAKRPTNYVDATNLTPQERQHWIKLAKDYGYEVHAVFFDVPLEVCIDRHHRRDRVVAEDVMRRMAAKLKPPSFEEGFAKITVVRVKKKEE